MFNRKEYRKRYYLKNREKELEYQKKYAQEHKQDRKEYHKKYRKEHQEKIKNQEKEYKKNKLNKDISFKLSHYLRIRLNHAIKSNSKSASVINLLGCSIKFFKEYLEAQFTVGMNWDNYGLWHIDHIKPCASFDLSKAEEQSRCFNYTNLRPLWAKENLERPKK